jgi:hypothetical protein
MLQRIIPDTKPRLDFLALGFWVSSILAAILAIPSIGVFVYFFTVLDNILVGALLAFGIHFVILSVSDRIANFLIRTIDGEKIKRDIQGFMASDFFTFETDEENVMVLSINEDGKERKDVHSYMLEHQVFHVALNRYFKKTPKLTY